MIRQPNDSIKLSPRSQLRLNMHLSIQYKSKREFKLCVFCCRVFSIKSVYQLLLVNDIFLSANLFVLGYTITFSWLFNIPNLVQFLLSSAVYVH